MNKILLIGIIALLLIKVVAGIGIAPADPEILFEPNVEKTLDLIIINNEEREMNVNINVESEFSVVPENNTLFFKKGEREKNLKVNVKLPQEMEAGPNIAKISVSEEAKPGMIAAFVTVVSKLTVFVPYPGKYLKASLVKTEFKLGSKGNFIIEIQSLGEEKIDKAKVELTLLDETKVVKTISSEVKDIERKSSYHKIPWIVDVSPGEYEAEAKVQFAEPIIMEFKVGEQKLEIQNIEAELNERATIKLYLLNNWNKKLGEAYAELDFIKDNKNHGRSPTQVVSFDKYEEKEVLAYWDTSALEPGLYNMQIKLNYLNKIEEHEFKALLTDTALIIQGFESIEKEKQANPIFYVILVLLIIIIAAVVLYFSNKNRD